MNSSILYWKWNNDVLDMDTMRERTMDIINRSDFDLIYICFHSVSMEYQFMTSDKGIAALNECIKIFNEHGRRVMFDMQVESDGIFARANSDTRGGFVRFVCGTLDQSGEYKGAVETATDVVCGFAVDFSEDGKRFSNPVDITDKCLADDGNVSVRAEEQRGRGFILYVSRKGNTIDMMDDDFFPLREQMFERMSRLPLSGAATDEAGIGFALERECLIKDPKPIDALDITKVNYYANWFPFSEGMCKRYNERYKADLKYDLLYFWHMEEGNEAKSLRIVNQYHENIRLRLAEIEGHLYDSTKKYFGEDAFVGAHPTWWGDELDNNFEAYDNGLDWWETKRDFAQTDELIIMPVRLAMSRKCGGAVWYNMWYSMRTMDIRSYYKETYTNVIYGGRTHWLGYECYEPGVVLCLNAPGLLEGAAEVERKVKQLDELQASRPDARVLVVFGYEAVCNHYISNPGDMRIERRGIKMHNVLKNTKKLFEHPYLCEMVPTTEIENGSVSFEGNKVSYCGHEYDAAVVMYPDCISKETFDKLNSFEKSGGNMIVCGDINVYSNGETADVSFADCKRFMPEVSADEIASELEKMGIAHNCGEGWCRYEDGSIVAANPCSNKSAGNGVKAEIDGKSFACDDKDILYINAELSDCVKFI